MLQYIALHIRGYKKSLVTLTNVARTSLLRFVPRFESLTIDCIGGF